MPCFVLIAIRFDAEVRLKPTFGPNYLLGPSRNRSLAAVLPNGFRQFTLMAAKLHLELYHQRRSAAQPSPQDEERGRILRAKYQGLGWTAERVEEAVLKATINRLCRFPHTGLRGDAAAKIAELAAVAGPVGVVAYFAATDAADAPIPFGPSLRVLAEWLPLTAANFPENTLVWVTNDDSRGTDETPPDRPLSAAIPLPSQSISVDWQPNRPTPAAPVKYPHARADD